MSDELIKNIDKLHTTEMGVERIKKSRTDRLRCRGMVPVKDNG